MFYRFHKSASCLQGRGSITDLEFDMIVKHVGAERILSPNEWLIKLRTNKLKTDHLCITYDDGLKSQFKVADKS